jgi:hypothetical protein
MEYFVSFNYLSKNGAFLFDNKIIKLVSVSEESIKNAQKELELEFNSRPDRLKIVFIKAID